MNLHHFSTKDRILHAAEELFAQQGFGATSLRQVTSRADVNVAAVNYHFGSKDNLVNEVFRRRMDDMSRDRLNALQAAVIKHPGELEPILAAFVEPALAMAQDRHGGGAFIRVIARAYAENNDTLRKSCPTSTATCYEILPRQLAPACRGLARKTCTGGWTSSRVR